MNPLHEISTRYIPDHDIRQKLQSAWMSAVGNPQSPLPEYCIAEAPFVMSEQLHSRLGICLAQVYHWLKKKLNSGHWQQDSDWPGVCYPDVLAIDVAITHEPKSPDGWGVNLVEFQAFHSVAVTVYGLHLAWTAQHSWLQDMAPYALPQGTDDWLTQTRDWCAPAQSILLERQPLSQPTAFDLLATSRLFNLTLTEPQQLHAVNGRLYRTCENRNIEVEHILNRLILSDAPRHGEIRKLITSTKARWSGHPAWFGRINKGLLPEVPVPAHQRSVRADRWYETGLHAADLVLKSALSWGGTDVHLHVTEQQLKTLKNPEKWIVQPRFQMFPVATARDGAPLYSEIRCLLAISSEHPPWIVSRFARVVRKPLASLSTWTGLAGEGLAPVYAPPGSSPDLPSVD